MAPKTQDPVLEAMFKSLDALTMATQSCLIHLTAISRKVGVTEKDLAAVCNEAIQVAIKLEIEKAGGRHDESGSIH